MFQYFIVEFWLIGVFFLISFIIFYNTWVIKQIKLNLNLFIILIFIGSILSTMVSLQYFLKYGNLTIITSFATLSVGSYTLQLIFLILNGFLLFYQQTSNIYNGVEKPTIQYNSINIGLILIYILAGLLVFKTHDLFLLFLTFELQGFLIYILILQYPMYSALYKTIFNFIVLNAVTVVFFLLGISQISSFYGTLSVIELQFLSSLSLNLIYKNIQYIIFFCLFFLIYKLGATPFFFWLKSIYKRMPILVLTFINVNTKLIYFYIFYIFSHLYLIQSHLYQSVILIIGLCTIFIGVFLTYPQQDLKSFLIYSSLPHVGYLITLSYGFINASIIIFFWCYLLNYLITITFIWVLISSLDFINKRPLYFSDLKYFIQQPLKGILICCSLLSLAGIPPFIGFFFKYDLLMNLYTLISLKSLSLIFILSGILSTYYYLKPLFYFFFETFSHYTLNQIIQPLNFKFMLFGGLIYIIVSPAIYNTIFNFLLISNLYSILF